MDQNKPDYIPDQQAIEDAHIMSTLLRNMMINSADPSTQLVATIELAISELPDDYWTKLVEHSKQPCPRPGCTCHVVTGQTMDALTVLRTEGKKIITERDQHIKTEGMPTA